MLAFETLADPTRRRILELLAERERSAGEILSNFHVSQPAVSQHLRKLRDAGLVEVRQDAQRRVYRINPEGFRETEEWMSRTRGAWNRRVASLERELRRRLPRRGTVS
ncbi:MAG: winged helix-turn-helix transcriptional regulator [Euryarchaeota archaeon]|nr:winged helix-turn-helix transcriptional regulator [Euryarchaeota archaeon]MDE1835870.1 winged helix-turn-helix transcriptional regulator [Euryarchaeota archaeon]MDE1882118.1 winged helix-turn-helix transcriptional regulator [Euryarchaeota archaeon]MDE2044452.1 winged helix-turn-helix transcriptional regulator [Thermoplasmata archaeon]